MQLVSRHSPYRKVGTTKERIKTFNYGLVPEHNQQINRKQKQKYHPQQKAV